MIKNIVFDMGNVLLLFDRDRFLDAVGVERRQTGFDEQCLSLARVG